MVEQLILRAADSVPALVVLAWVVWHFLTFQGRQAEIVRTKFREAHTRGIEAFEKMHGKREETTRRLAEIIGENTRVLAVVSERLETYASHERKTRNE